MANSILRKDHWGLPCKALVVCLALLGANVGIAQYRADQPTVTPPTVTESQPIEHLSEPFKSQYRAAGRPRLMLFWNVAFDDATASMRQDVDRTQSSSSHASSELDQQADEPMGSSRKTTLDEHSGETVERVTGSRIVDSAKHETPLAPALAAQLEGAFRHDLQVADLRLISRDFEIRMTKAGRDRGDVDSKLVESDAVIAGAEWLLEILLVPDANTPMGVGFEVTLTDVKAGTQQLSFYTPARPMLVTSPTYYVATKTGFERWLPAAHVTAADVGAELAREVVDSLSLMLPTTHKSPMADIKRH